ncbi:MAG: hypothetical protein K8I02_07030, partial [Candidatus Methylomirabilis sp.]|nr:hypothetical protein [Deltaproteobacteria bacterium]
MLGGVNADAPLPDAWVAFDVETTGLYPGPDRIIEVAAVRFARGGHVRVREARDPRDDSRQALSGVHERGEGARLLAAREADGGDLDDAVGAGIEAGR